MARRHPSGRRGQAGRRGDGGHRSGGPGYDPGLFSPLRTSGRHDRHGARLGRGNCDGFTAATCCRFRPTGPPSDSGGPSECSAPPTRNGRPLSRKCASCTPRRPVLIGTRSIDKSEKLSKLLDDAGIAHQVLNANHVATEAEIVASAGERGKVTVSTNMAGRGTDIKLGEGVADLGGLHVICTEMHDASRIDRQLIGRCGRQGDPGTFRQYLALDDDLLLAGLGPKNRKSSKSAASSRTDHSSSSAGCSARPSGRSSTVTSASAGSLMYFEKDRKKMQRQMGQDPYLDTPG